MRCLQFSMTAALLAVLGTIAFAADSQNPKHPPIGTNPNPVIWGGQPQSNRPPIGTNPNPITWGGQSNKPAPSVTQPANNSSGNVASSTYPMLYPAFESAPYRHAAGTLIYNPFTGQYQYYPGGYGSYGYPAVYTSPDVSYGPQAAQRLTSADTRSRWKNDSGGALLRRDDDMSEPKKTSERDAGAQSNSLAWKFIGFGDARFAEQKYLDANDRYRSAARSAPQLADPLFREGFAMLALGHYQQAMTAIRRGLKLDPQWAVSDFELKMLYGEDNDNRKEAHREALAAALEASPDNPDLLFLLGLHLYFDGQTERAANFFQRVHDIAPEDADSLKGFPVKP